jgi:hypothetical protein
MRAPILAFYGFKKEDEGCSSAMLVVGVATRKGFIARKPRDGKPHFVAALPRMTGEEGIRKEEAGPSPIRASRAWVRDDTKSDCERQRQKTEL